MKTKFLKVSLLILAFSLVIGAAVATVISANETKTPEIISQNIEYNEKFSIMFAVKQSSVTDPANLKLKLYDKNPADPDAQLLRTYTEYKSVAAGADNNLSADSYVFTTDGVAATGMLTDIYAVVVEGDKISNVKKYSVAEYLYERLGSSDLTEKQAEFYNATIDFGASAQKVVSGETNSGNLITNYRYVTVEGGTINGFAAGVYPINSTQNVVKDDASNSEQWRHFYYDEIGMPQNAKTDSAFTVQDSPKNTLVLYDVNAKRLGLENFEGYEVSGPFTAKYGQDTADGLFKGQRDGSVDYYFEEAENRGMVAKLDNLKWGNAIMINRNNAVFSESEATAYECSFDIKIDMASIDSLKEKAIRLRWYSTENVLFNDDVYLYVDKNGNTTELWANTSLGFLANLDDTRDWFNMRIVVYKGDNHMYIYINNSETYNNYFTLSSSYSGNIADLDGIAFLQYYTDSNGNNKTDYNDTSIYIDNVFCGFTKEANPTAAN